jgi:hypothetical protein
VCDLSVNPLGKGLEVWGGGLVGRGAYVVISLAISSLDIVRFGGKDLAGFIDDADPSAAGSNVHAEIVRHCEVLVLRLYWWH